MDYDFSEYCDDHLSKTFNPFTCELQPLVVSIVNIICFLCVLLIEVSVYFAQLSRHCEAIYHVLLSFRNLLYFSSLFVNMLYQ
jgi:hypothetical protein